MIEEFIIIIQIIFIDIILAADNAIIIGLIAANFAPKNRKTIILWGVGGDKKLASSSDLVQNARDFEQSLAPPVRTRTKHSDR